MECVLCRAFLNEPSPWAVARDGKEYFRCTICDLVWMNPAQRPAPEAELNRYLEHRNLIDDIAYLEYLARLAKPVCALISPEAKEKARGLDYGCGPSEGMRVVCEALGLRVTSYDPYFFPRTDLAPGSFQVLLCSEAAEHFFDPAKEFARIDSLVEKGGILGFSTGLVRGREEFLNWSYRRDPTHVIFFSEACVNWLSAKFGWQLLQLEGPRFIFRKAG
ncbi:MAG: class I SAM-dependent methyltransferase [Proteobacteria bacterium]|nr:MAG: class I SAM-dependent methyltransferase [Pseudomonadota bacterium]